MQLKVSAFLVIILHEFSHYVRRFLFEDFITFNAPVRIIGSHIK